MGFVMSFPTKVMLALAMVSIVIVMIITSIVHAQGIAGGGVGGIVMGGKDDVDFDGGDVKRVVIPLSDLMGGRYNLVTTEMVTTMASS